MIQYVYIIATSKDSKSQVWNLWTDFWVIKNTGYPNAHGTIFIDRWWYLDFLLDWLLAHQYLWVLPPKWTLLQIDMG